jgi:sugar phosphate isomerase/epimerase
MGVAAAAGCVPGATRSAPAPAAAGERPRSGLGLVIYSCAQERQARRREKRPDLSDPKVFLDYARGLGAGGIQTPLGVRDAAWAKALRAQAEEAGMYVEGIVSPPFDDARVARFDAELKTAALAGARAVRTVLIPGRRYEYFDTLEKFREYDRRGRKALERAAPVAERHRVRLAVENHKDHRIAERVALLKQYGGKYVGACVDAGNNLALLEDPVAAVEAFAPWAFCCHLKDQAVRETDEGFLLADVPLGQGCLDLKRMVDVLRKAKPDIRFSYETITRDPLRVPCRGKKFWATFPDVPRSDMERTLEMVRKHAAERLPAVGSLPPAGRLALERKGVRESLDYARRALNL